MSKDELIRVLASMRTDLNGKTLTLSAAAQQPEAANVAETIEMAWVNVGAAVEFLNSTIKDLGGRQ